MADIYANCRFCNGRGRRDGLGNGPCTFCSTERARVEKEELEYAQRRYQETGEWKEPGYREQSEVRMLDMKTGEWKVLSRALPVEEGLV